MCEGWEFADRAERGAEEGQMILVGATADVPRALQAQARYLFPNQGAVGRWWAESASACRNESSGRFPTEGGIWMERGGGWGRLAAEAGIGRRGVAEGPRCRPVRSDGLSEGEVC